MNSEYKYEVRGYRVQDDVSNGFGSATEIGCDTLREAKDKARFLLTETERQLSEASRCLGYSQVVNRFTGEIVADFFNNKICQVCGEDLSKLGIKRLEHNCKDATLSSQDNSQAV